MSLYRTSSPAAAVASRSTGGVASRSVDTPDNAYGLTSRRPPPAGASMPTKVAANDTFQMPAPPYDGGMRVR